MQVYLLPNKTHGIIAHVILISSGQINYRTPPTRHSYICGGVLITVIATMKQHDSPRHLCDSNHKLDLCKLIY